MGTFLKALAVVCILGIVGILIVVMLPDSPVQSAPSTADTPREAPSLILATTPPEPTTAPAPEPTGEPSSPAFWIEELTAECDESEDFAVSALPLGADWRTTERGVYNYSPVTLVCEVGGSTDDLTFEWSATDGDIQGSGGSIVWTAPAYGARVTVTVVVRNSSGRTESASMTFRVATCECVFKRY
jgi:hypothetical protein